MYTQELIKRVSDDTHLSERLIGEVLDSSLRVIRDSLKSGQEVRLPGFGVFYSRPRAASRAKDFSTGKPVDVPARKVAAFRAGSGLKRALYKPKR